MRPRVPVEPAAAGSPAPATHPVVAIAPSAPRPAMEASMSRRVTARADTEGPTGSPGRSDRPAASEFLERDVVMRSGIEGHQKDEIAIEKIFPAGSKRCVSREPAGKMPV